MFHGAGICIPTCAQHKSPSHVGVCVYTSTMEPETPQVPAQAWATRRGPRPKASAPDKPPVMLGLSTIETYSN